MRNFFLIFFIWEIAGNPAVSQNSFNLIYDLNNYLDIAQTSCEWDTGYILISTAKDMTIENGSLRITKTDFEGNFLKELVFDKFDTTYSFQKVLRSGANNFIACGVMASYNIPNFSYDVNYYIIKFNKNLDTVLTKQFGFGIGTEAPESFTIANNGDIVIVGGDQTDSFSNTAPIIIRLDSNGNYKWHQYYDNGNSYTYFSGICKLGNGDFAVTGRKSVSGDEDLWVVRIDSIGQVVWQQTYGVNNIDERGDDIILLSDSALFITAHTNTQAYFVKVEKDTGNLIYAKEIGDGGLDWPQRSFELPNGKIMSGGWTQAPGGNEDAWLIELDHTTGDSLWSQHYCTKGFGNASDDYAWDMLACSDGGFLLSGSSQGPYSSEQDAWVLKVDSLGNVDSTVCYPWLFDGVQEIHSDKSVSIYPNPASDQLNIESSQPISSIIIHDLLGREIFSKEFNSAQCQLNIANWNSGVYLVKIITDEGGVVKKIVVE